MDPQANRRKKLVLICLATVIGLTVGLDFVSGSEQPELALAEQRQVDRSGIPGKSSVQVVNTNFDSQPANMTLRGDAVIQSGQLELTSATFTQKGIAEVTKPVIDQTLVSISANFDLYIWGGSGADGFGFNYGVIPGDYSTLEPDEGLGGALSVTIDTYLNGGADRIAMEVKYAGATLAYDDNVTLRYDHYVPMTIEVTAAGLVTVTHNGVTIFNNVAVPGWNPQPNWQFILGGRTGGSTDNHWVDNLVIRGDNGTQVPLIPGKLTGIFAAICLLTGASFLLTRRSDPGR